MGPALGRPGSEVLDAASSSLPELARTLTLPLLHWVALDIPRTPRCANTRLLSGSEDTCCGFVVFGPPKKASANLSLAGSRQG